MRCRSTLAVLCGLAMLPAAACTENPSAGGITRTPATTTTTPSPTATPRPVAPVAPAAAKARTKAGVEAFARHWMAARSYMVATGNSAVFLRLGQPACEWCRDLAKIYEGVFKAGGSYSGDLDGQVTQILLSDLSSEHSGYVQFRAAIPAHTKVPSKAASPELKKLAVLDYTLNLDYVKGEWRVRRANWNTVREG